MLSSCLHRYQPFCNTFGLMLAEPELMEGSSASKSDKSNKIDEEEDEEVLVRDEEYAELMQNLPAENDGVWRMINYQGFWFPDITFRHVLTFQRHFQARDSDIIIASFPKTGNTWLKSLLFAVVNRCADKNLNLLHQKHPHELVCHLENDVYGKAFEYPQPRHLDQMPSPRLFSTHLPYRSLPESITTSNCKILYLSRNPLDTFVSFYYFTASAEKKMLGDNEEHELPNMDDYLERKYCQGKALFGPFLDHVKEYWEKSLEQTGKMMFLMYEDLKDDAVVQVKRIAEFVGVPFSPLEERQGVVEKIVNLCDFNHLKEVEANKTGVINKFFDKKSYFRKGKVGDWMNHLNPATGDRLMKYTEDAVRDTGLSFKFNKC